MWRRSILLALLLSSLMTANAGVELTPAMHQYTANGIQFIELIFKDGDRQVVYEPPRGWAIRGGGNALQLNPAIERSDALIQATPLPTSAPLDEKAIALLKQRALAALPGGSQAAAIVEEEQNSLSLDGATSYGLTTSFEAMGEAFLRNTLFVNLPDTQLVFRLTGRKLDFPALERAFRSSLLSWHWVSPATKAEAPQEASPRTPEG